jgi:hypothetical protein
MVILIDGLERILLERIKGIGQGADWEIGWWD